MVNPTYLVGVGGVVGAVLRNLVSQSVDGETFPLGTFTVNVVGSFVLGALTFLGLDDQTLLLLGTGACGSFTTFSSFSVGVVQLWEDGERLTSVAFATTNLVGALVAIGLAWLVTRGV